MDKNATLSQLESLLSEGVAAAQLREREAFDAVARSCKERIVLFGAGGLGRRTLAGLRGAGIEPLAFVDNNPANHGREIEGVPVLSPGDAAKQYGDDAVFVVTIWGANSPHRYEHSLKQLEDLGCKRVVTFAHLYWKYPEVFLPFYCRDLPHKILEQADEVRRACELWSDEKSRQQYVKQVQWRLFPDFNGLSHPDEHAQYFPDEISIDEREKFVDCGAFDGDTLKVFLEKTGENFGRFIALEPDPLNYRKLEAFALSQPEAVRNKIALYDVAAGDAEGTITMETTGTASSATGKGDTEVRVVPLDSFLDEAPSWLKLDIEGAEPQALQGAAGWIAGEAPVIAVCVYHLQDHLWKIPLMLKSLRDDYRFFLRSHNEEGWDLVCYAVPAGRWRSA